MNTDSTQERIRNDPPEVLGRRGILKDAKYYLDMCEFEPKKAPQIPMGRFFKPILNQFEAFQPPLVPETAQNIITPSKEVAEYDARQQAVTELKPASVPVSSEVAQYEASVRAARQQVAAAESAVAVSPEVAEYAASVGDSAAGYVQPTETLSSESSELDHDAILASIYEMHDGKTQDGSIF